MIYDYRYEITKIKHKFCIWFARKFPYISLWCFIVITGESGRGPCSCYSDNYDHWKNKYKLKDM